MDFDNIFEGLKENKKTLIVALILIIAMIIISVLNLVFGNRKEKVDMEGVLKSFAELYYEEYYYPDVKKNYGNDYSEQLKKDSDEGIILTLREIVNTFDDVNRAKFSEEGNYCDFLETYAIIYPESPYDLKDYKIKINISCKKEMREN